MMMIRETQEPMDRPLGASQPAKASCRDTPPSKKPPVYTRPSTQPAIRMMTGSTRSMTLPLGLNFISATFS